MTKYSKLFNTKKQELKEREMHLKSAECTATENTKSSQLNKVRRERKTLALIEELVSMLPEDKKLSPNSHDHLINILTLVSERQSAIHFECKPGDKVIDLLQKYSTMNKLMQRMTTYCDKHQLTVSWEKGIIVAKDAVKEEAKKSSK